MEKQSFIRIFILIILSVIAIYFIYFLNAKSSLDISKIRSGSAPDLDSIIIKTFEKFNIPKTSLQYKKIKFVDTEFVRDEISVNIPVIIPEDSLFVVKTDTLILLIHYDLKQELSKYDYKISGVENSLENKTIFFIEEKGKIIKTIIFKIQIKKERSISYQLKNKRK